MRYLVPAAVLALLSPFASVAALAEDAAPAAPVAVVVAIPTPPGVPETLLKQEFEKAAPRYQQIPGLKRKYFTLGNGTFGGIYYWSSKAAADAWFNDAWYARVDATYHAKPSVTYFQVPLAIEGTRP